MKCVKPNKGRPEPVCHTLMNLLMKHITGHLDNGKINNKQLIKVGVCRFCSAESAWAAHKETKADPANSSIQVVFKLKKTIQVTAIGF